jgi:hypothetical protein
VVRKADIAAQGFVAQSVHLVTVGCSAEIQPKASL